MVGPNTSRGAPISTERIDKYRAAQILGCSPRAVVSMAAAGKLAVGRRSETVPGMDFRRNAIARLCAADGGGSMRSGKAGRRAPAGCYWQYPLGAAFLSAGRNSADRLIRTMRKLQKAVVQPCRSDSWRSSTMTPGRRSPKCWGLERLDTPPKSAQDSPALCLFPRPARAIRRR
jgi:hypothetical protein